VGDCIALSAASFVPKSCDRRTHTTGWIFSSRKAFSCIANDPTGTNTWAESPRLRLWV